MSGRSSEVLERFDQWLYGNDPRAVPPLRIAFAVMLMVYTIVWWLNADRWFTDEGILSAQSAQELGDHSTWSLFFVLPSTPPIIHACLATLFLQVCLVLVGAWSRLNMACIFIWLVSFQQRNPLICDGEDTVFRLFAFLMMWLPLDCGWSVTRWWAARHDLPLSQPDSRATWALTLMQVEMTFIYASATWNKLQGQTWRDGTSMYYVSLMSDHFGRIPGSQYWFDQLWFVKLTTWSALGIEAILPIVLWIPRLRLYAVVLGIALHLGIEALMHLFLFEWIMIFGLMTFAGRRFKPR